MNPSTRSTTVACRALSLACFLSVLAFSGVARGQNGACCWAKGCTETDQGNCESLQGGAFLGAGTTCTESACMGACCNYDGSCAVVDPNDTLAGCGKLGEFFGYGTSCDTAVCDGACCMDDGTCTVGSHQACVSGTYQGADTTCESNCTQPLCTVFTYQGRLTETGQPIDDLIDVEASLWAVPEGGDQVGATLSLGAVEVTGGFFTIQLDFGANALDGHKRWIQLAVRVPHDPTDADPFVVLEPRQPLTGTPYALQTRGIFVDDDFNVGIGTTSPGWPLQVDSDQGFSLYVRNTDAGANATAVYGWTRSSTGSGVSGVAGAATGLNRAVSGHTNSSDGYAAYFTGVDGSRNYFQEPVGIGTETPAFPLDVVSSDGAAVRATNDNSAGIALWGIATGSSGVGVLGDAPGPSGVGVKGMQANPNGAKPAVYGETMSKVVGTAAVKGSALGNAIGATYGVFGNSQAAVDAVGVRGECCSGNETGPNGCTGHANPTCTGVEGEGERFGVHGTANNVLGEGVHGDGNTGVYGRGGAVGVYGESTATDGIGVQGVHAARDGTAPGVLGETTSAADGAVGVLGRASASPSGIINTYGVWGESAAAYGIGVYGTGNIGVEGDTDTGHGVHGVAGGAGTAVYAGGFGTGKGLWAETFLGSGTAVTALSGTGFAVNADSTGNTAVRAETHSPTAYAGYFVNHAGGGAALRLDAPTALIADGDIEVSGTASAAVIEITGADLAEKFPLSEPVEPGYVVAIDPSHPGKLCLSRSAYNKRVAGIVSGANNLNAGVVLGNSHDSKAHRPVALSGRVWVHCDATTRAIEPGDFLTTADRPGYAMPITDAQRATGAMIGKAMTALAEGETGLVLVLVNLQ